jgi:hypothetical protein
MFLIVAVGLLAIAIFFAIKYFGVMKRFEPVLSLDAEAERVRKEIDKNWSEAERAVEQAKSEATELVSKAKSKASELNANYDQAKQIFDRLQYELSLLQEDAENISFGVYKPHYAFDAPEEFKAALERIYERKKLLVRGDSSGAIKCPTAWEVNNSRTEGKRMIRKQAKLMMRAFNGECDAAIAKVVWNNATKMEERVRKAFEAVNSLGEVMHTAITAAYLDLCLAELRLTYEYEMKKQEVKEEQREIREQMREEERAQREFEKAQREAAAEQERAEKALAAARAELEKASGEHLEAIELQITDLEQKIADAQAKQDHAVSMAQVTKMGHVYVISNLGSFGEDVFKIGMTRRLEPGDRVYELSGASVPFSFDIHAMIFSNDAPGLENSFHQQFSSRRLNLVNSRKEYFRVTLDEIVNFAESKEVKVEFTKLAEARQFRESEAIRLKASQAGVVPEAKAEVFPDKLLTDPDED